MALVPSGSAVEHKTALSFLDQAIVLNFKISQGTESVGDKTSLKSTLTSGSGCCDKHPEWTIIDRGREVAKLKGDSTFSFLPPVVNPTEIYRVMDAWWLKDIKPRVYSVSCQTCRGESRSLELSVYPNIKSEASFTFGEPHERNLGSHRIPKGSKRILDINSQFGGLEIFKKLGCDLKKHIELEHPKGVLKFSNGWDEQEKGHLAQWSCTLEVNLDPILGMKKKIPLVVALAVLELIPETFREYANIEVYAEFGVALKMESKLTFKKPTRGKTELEGEEERGLGGEFSVEVAAEAWVAKDDYEVFTVKLYGKTGVELSGGFGFNDEEIEFLGSAKWQGLSAGGFLRLMNGHWTTEDNWVILGPAEAKLSRVLLTEKHRAGETEERHA